MNSLVGCEQNVGAWVKKLTFCASFCTLTQLRRTRRGIQNSWTLDPTNRPTTNLATAAVYLGKYFEPFKQFPLTNMRKLPIGGFTNKLQRKIFVKNGQAKAKSMEYMFKLFQPKCMKYLYKLFLCTSLNISAI